MKLTESKHPNTSHKQIEILENCPDMTSMIRNGLETKSNEEIPLFFSYFISHLPLNSSHYNPQILHPTRDGNPHIYFQRYIEKITNSANQTSLQSKKRTDMTVFHEEQYLNRLIYQNLPLIITKYCFSKNFDTAKSPVYQNQLSHITQKIYFENNQIIKKLKISIFQDFTHFIKYNDQIKNIVTANFSFTKKPSPHKSQIDDIIQNLNSKLTPLTTTENKNKKEYFDTTEKIISESKKIEKLLSENFPDNSLPLSTELINDMIVEQTKYPHKTFEQTFLSSLANIYSIPRVRTDDLLLELLHQKNLSSISNRLDKMISDRKFIPGRIEEIKFSVGISNALFEIDKALGLLSSKRKTPPRINLENFPSSNSLDQIGIDGFFRIKVANNVGSTRQNSIPEILFQYLSQNNEINYQLGKYFSATKNDQNNSVTIHYNHPYQITLSQDQNLLTKKIDQITSLGGSIIQFSPYQPDENPEILFNESTIADKTLYLTRLIDNIIKCQIKSQAGEIDYSKSNNTDYLPMIVQKYFENLREELFIAWQKFN